MTQDCRRPQTLDWLIAAVLAVVLGCAGTVLSAQEVTIRTADGGLQLTGRVISFDGTYLQLDTVHGVMTVAYDAELCEGAGCPPAEGYVPIIRMSGADRMGDVLVPALIEAFGRSRGLASKLAVGAGDLATIDLVETDGATAAVFRLRRSTTDEGFADLIAFEADVVMATRAVRPEEAERARLIGLGDITDPRQARILGYDALVPVVSPGLGLRNISLADIARAYRGEIGTWAEIGGPDLPILLHLGPQTSGGTQFLVDAFLGGAPAAGVTYHPGLAELAAVVAETPGSLGVLPFAETGNAQPLAIADPCGFTAVAQTPMVKTQDYPLTQPLFLYLPDRLQPALVQDFLSWLRGPEAQLVVRRAGFVDQGAVPIPLDAQGQRFVNAIAQAGDGIGLADLQGMVAVLAPLTRLSTSFRFLEPAGTDLDAPSRSHLMALAQAVRDGRYDGQRLYLVGFGTGDDAGDVDAPPASLTDAQVVALALTDVLGDWPVQVTLTTVSFGAALPMGCDYTPWGAQRKRRVELWVDQDPSSP